MKVLFLTPWYPHLQNSNSGVFIRDQAELAVEENEVMVVFSTVDYTKFSLSRCSIDESSYKGIKEYRIVVRRSFLLFNQMNFLLLTLWHTWRVSRKFKPDVIQANVSYPSAVFAWVLARLLKCPYFVIEHTRITNHFRSYFHRLSTLKTVRMASARFAVSNTLSREMNTLLNKEVGVLPNVVDFDRFRISPFPDSVPQIGFLGGLNTNVKGLDILLRTLATIDRDYRVHIGGRGPLLEGYMDLAKELGITSKCKFYGFVPHAEIPEFMSQLHFFVSSSRYETFGVVIAEAMASGLPVVVSKSGGPDDFVDAGSGIIVPVEDTHAMGEAIVRMMDSYRTFDRKKIAEKIRSLFSRKIIQTKLNVIYAELVSSE